MVLAALSLSVEIEEPFVPRWARLKTSALAEPSLP
jgi:hypothetical protein